MAPASWLTVSGLTVFEQQPSATDKEMLGRQEMGIDSCMEAPEGIMTVSVLFCRTGGLGVWTRAMEEGLDDGAEAVGTVCWDAMASCRRHLTSSAEDRSTGACPSWFFKNGSAPWASCVG